MVRAVDEDEEIMRGLVEQCLVGHLYMQSAPTFTSNLDLSSEVQSFLSNTSSTAPLDVLVARLCWSPNSHFKSISSILPHLGKWQ